MKILEVGKRPHHVVGELVGDIANGMVNITDATGDVIRSMPLLDGDDILEIILYWDVKLDKPTASGLLLRGGAQWAAQWYYPGRNEGLVNPVVGRMPLGNGASIVEMSEAMKKRLTLR